MRYLANLIFVIAISLLQACGGSSNRDQLNTQQPTTPPTGVDLFTTAPPAITMASGAGASSFTIGGGTAPYAASSSNLSVAQAVVNGSTVQISSVSVGDATVTISDTLGAKVELALSVGASATLGPLRSSAPSNLALVAGTSRTYSVSGGQSPYAASSGDETVAVATLSGTSVTLAAVSPGTAQILLIDATGTQEIISLTVGEGTPPVPLAVLAPEAVTVSTGAQVANYVIRGGTAPYTTQSSNAALVRATVTGSALLSLSGLTAGSAVVNVFDSAGGSVSLPVTVLSATGAALSASPNGAAGNVGDTLSFTLQGGSPPYTLSSSNSNIANLTASTVAASGGSVQARLVNVGDAIVTVHDLQGQTVSFVVSAGSAAPLLRVSPNAFVVGENDVSAIEIRIYGGTPPYRVLSSDLVKAAVAISGNVMTTTPGTSTNRCINPVEDGTSSVYIRGGTYAVTLTVIDSLGASATSVMTIKDNSGGFALACP